MQSFLTQGLWGLVLKPGSGELELDTSFAAVAEAGVKREAGESSSFYIGLFINYGLNTINKQSGTASTLQYHTSAPTDFESQAWLRRKFSGLALATSGGVDGEGVLYAC